MDTKRKVSLDLARRKKEKHTKRNKSRKKPLSGRGEKGLTQFGTIPNTGLPTEAKRNMGG